MGGDVEVSLHPDCSPENFLRALSLSEGSRNHPLTWTHPFPDLHYPHLEDVMRTGCI
jgi:hypothetical protein